MPTLASGFDRDDGSAGRLGVPDPAGSVRTDSNDGTSSVATSDATIPQEVVGSPTIERAEQLTISKQWNLSWNEAITRQAGMPRGAMRVDSAGNVTRILSTKVKHRAGQGAGMADMEVVSEGVSSDPPWDKFECVPVELGLNIIKHPRYLYALQGSTADEGLLNQGVIRAIQDYMANPNSQFRQATVRRIYASMDKPGTVTSGNAVPAASFTYTFSGESSSSTVYPVTGTNLAKRAALEIIQKHWRGEETPYVVGFMLTWTRYYFRPPYINPGGYVEDPIYDAAPQLPDYFWSPDYPPSSATVFDYIAAINPQCYSSTGLASGSPVISWLRKADVVTEQRTWFECVRTWLGAPVGHWDTALYAATRRPIYPDDYEKISPSALAPVFG